MRTSPQQLEAFTYAARERSFTAAAKALGVTQSAITQHVANLERAMGVQLFVRHRTGLELTKSAQDLFRLSDRLCTVEQLIAEQLEAYGALETGHLRIIANAPRPAMPLVTEFSQRYPDVRLMFQLMSWTAAMERVKQRDVDIAVITEPDNVAGLYSLELSQSRYMAYMRSDHQFARRKSISLAQLKNEHVIVPEAGSLTQRVIDEQLFKHNLTLDRLMEMTTFPMVKEAVLHGVGIGILLDQSFYPSPEIVMRPIKEIRGPFRTSLVTPADKSELRFVRSFIDIAEQHAA